MDESSAVLNDVKLLVFEQKVCMESWFLGNRKVFECITELKSIYQMDFFMTRFNITNE